MRRQYDHRRLLVALQELATRAARVLRIDAEAAAPVGLLALHRVVHQVSAHDAFIGAATYVDTHVARRMAGRGIQPDLVVEGVSEVDEFGLSGFDDRQDGV
jgi:hypothetical protein